MKKQVLITAYAVNPYKGSEDGIAWNIIRNLATHNKIIAITRKNNEAPIADYLAKNPLPEGVELNFAYFDLPYWMRFWKRGARGALLYHYLWHLMVVFYIKKEQFKFDLTHHLNFNNDWTPSFLWLLGKPFVWGPIGHHPKIPKAYTTPYGKKRSYLESIKWMVKKCFWRFDPFLKITKSKAEKIIALNSSVQKVLNVPEEKITIIPAAGNRVVEVSVPKNEKFTILSIGRLVALKGFDITINAFAKFYWRLSEAQRKNVQLVIIGKGPQKKYLEQLIVQHQLPSTAIYMKDWMERKSLSSYYASSHVFLFPSHEGAGMVVPEALSYGLPVVCFDNYGPGELMDKSCGLSFPYTTIEQSIQDFSMALDCLFNDSKLQRSLSEGAIRRFKSCFTWGGKGQQIQAVYDGVGEEWSKEPFDVLEQVSIDKEKLKVEML